MPPAPVPLVALMPMRIDDYAFALALYLETNAPLLTKLGNTDDNEIADRFKRGYRLSQSRLIVHDAETIGWMQVSETSFRLHLHQIFIVAHMRNRGIGTSLISRLQLRARKMAKPLSLNVVRGNPAQSLYHRLGFTVVGERDGRLQMRWSGQSPHSPHTSPAKAR